MTVAEYRKRLKAAHLCRECKKVDAYTLGGRTVCAECAARNAARQRERRQDEADHVNALQRESRAALKQRRREAGLCTQCGRAKTGPGDTCGICKARRSRQQREYRIANGVNWPRGGNGFCWLCNKRSVIPGKRLCQVCYDERMRYLTPEVAERGRETMRRQWAEAGRRPEAFMGVKT